MKKHWKEKQFLEEFSKTPVVNAVCGRINLSRQSIYRWLEEDKEFRTKFFESLSQGRDNVNDLMESQLISKGQQGDYRAVIYWLEHHHKDYLPLGRIKEEKKEGLAELIKRARKIF